MKIYYSKWSKNTVAFLTGENDGDVYETHAINNAREKTTAEIEEYLKEISILDSEDELIEVK